MRRTGSVVALALLSFTVAVAADKPALQRVPGDDVLAWVEIPDIKRSIDHIEAAADKFVQAAGADETVVAQAVGQLIGDQELAALKPGAPVVLVVFAPVGGAVQPDVAWYIPVKDAAALQQAATRWRQQTVLVDDVLVLSDKPARLDRAKAAIATYQALAAAPAPKGVRIHLSIARALAQWGPAAKMGIESAAAMAGMADPKNGAATGNVVRLELHALLHLLGQVEDLQIDAETDAEALTLRYQLAAKPDTALAKLLAGPPAAKGQAGLLMPPATEAAFVAMQARFDHDAFVALFDGVLDHLAAEPATKALLTADDVAKFKPLMVGWGGDIAMRMGIGDDGKLRTTAVSKVGDAKFGELMVATMTAMLADDGAIGRLYKDGGMRMQLQPSVREHDGVAINRLFTDIDASKLPPEQAKLMQSFVVDNDFAFTDGWYVAGSGPGAIDALIDRAHAVAAGKPPGDAGLALKATQVHGAGRALYLDYDVVGLFGAMMARMMPGAQPPKGEHEPITAAADFLDGVSVNDVRVPYEPILSLIQTVQNQVHQAQPAPAEQNAPTF